MLTWYEQQFLDEWKSEYNISTLANSNQGVKRSDEYKKRVGDSFRGKKLSDEHRKRIGLANRLIKPSRSKTGFKGVTINGNKFTAHMGINGKQTYLGTFFTPEEASEAYKKATDLLILREGG